MTEQKTHYVRPDVQGFLAFLNGTDAPPMSQLGLEAARASYIAMGQLAEADPRELAVIRDLTCPGPAGEIPLRLYDLRETRAAGPAVMNWWTRSFSRETAAAMMRARKTSEKMLAGRSSRLANCGRRWRTVMPQMIGRIVTRVSCPSVFQKGSATSAPAPRNQSIDQRTIHGMVKTQTTLETAVRVTERARRLLVVVAPLPRRCCW